MTDLSGSNDETHIAAALVQFLKNNLVAVKILKMNINGNSEKLSLAETVDIISHLSLNFETFWKLKRYFLKRTCWVFTTNLEVIQK